MPNGKIHRGFLPSNLAITSIQRPLPRVQFRENWVWWNDSFGEGSLNIQGRGHQFGFLRSSRAN